MTHPSKDITGTSGTQLSGKKIALLVSSSVAAFKVPEIARELMRHGADVYAVISPSTEKMIGSDLLEWATGNPVVRELTGKLEHIALAGKSSGHADLVLIAPATANTIGKLASGIDDTPVTTVAATAIGSKLPVLIAPAMHEPLYDHPIAQENIARLKKIGVEFVEPEIIEGKAKIASTAKIVPRPSWRASVSHSSVGFPNSWRRSTRSTRSDRAANGFPTACRTWNSKLMIFASSSPCIPTSSITHPRNYWYTRAMHASATLRLVPGCFTDWVRIIRICLDSSCCFRVVSLRTAASNCGAPASCPVFTRGCNAVRMANPYCISTTPRK